MQKPTRTPKNFSHERLKNNRILNLVTDYSQAESKNNID